MGTLLEKNISKLTSYVFGRRPYCFCVYTLNRKCHKLSANVTKLHFNSTSKTTRPWGQAGRDHKATTVMRPRPVITRPTPGLGLDIAA